jgi:hypothetical protein
MNRDLNIIVFIAPGVNYKKGKGLKGENKKRVKVEI